MCPKWDCQQYRTVMYPYGQLFKSTVKYLHQELSWLNPDLKYEFFTKKVRPDKQFTFTNTVMIFIPLSELYKEKSYSIHDAYILTFCLMSTLTKHPRIWLRKDAPTSANFEDHQVLKFPVTAAYTSTGSSQTGSANCQFSTLLLEPSAKEKKNTGLKRLIETFKANKC